MTWERTIPQSIRTNLHNLFFALSCLNSSTSFSSGFLFLLLLLSASIFYSLWHGAFRQTEAMLFEQCLLLDGLSFIFTHGAFPVPEQLYTWLHLELKEQAESLSPAKEQEHCDFYWAACILCLGLHPQLTKRGCYVVLIKWPLFRSEKLTRTSISILIVFAKTLLKSELVIHSNKAKLYLYSHLTSVQHISNIWHPKKSR